MSFVNPAKRPTLVYITVRWPFGVGEEFLWEEVAALQRKGIDISIAPRSPFGSPKSHEARSMMPFVLRNPPAQRGMGPRTSAAKQQRRLGELCGAIIRSSGSPATLAKNLMVVPRAVWIARALRYKQAQHIHAHWGATTATIGYLVSGLTGVPWSMTLHRGDIKADNMLREKAESAECVRCISESGREWFTRLAGAGHERKVVVIPMAVSLPDLKIRVTDNSRRPFQIVVPANLVPVKGHFYLIEAVRMLKERGITGFHCRLFGNGPLRNRLQKQIRSANLSGQIQLCGHIDRKELIGSYLEGRVDAVLLPSITTQDGEHEGIPVSLIEAMACGIPVVSTRSGSIGELVEKSAGILVPEKDAASLAEAIRGLMENPGLTSELSRAGRKRIEEGFNIERTVGELIRCFGPALHERSVACPG